MTRKSKPAGLLRFASFRLDAVNACLWRGTKTIRLTPKAFAVLQYLVERPGELVTKDALLEAVWPSTVVGDAVLKVCVREIRKALGDPAGTPRYIATVHRLGYRFIAGVADGAEQRRARDEPAALSPADPTPARHVRPEGAGHLVGRDRALDRLQMWLDAAWRGRRQVAFLTGEAGVGKTAVVDAFLERVAADPRVWIAQGQCVETYGTSEPYLPVLDALARLCRGSAADRLVPLLRRHAPTWLVEMPWLLDSGDRDTLQRELIGATRERMLREMAELVEALTAHAPLVLVLEDLHWSDAATIDLLSLIAGRREPARLLLIATYRPVEATLTASPVRELTRELEARGRAQSLSLALLGPPAVADYLRERFPGNAFPAELAHVIHARTEGNPLFMVTLVDDLLARGLIAPREHGWELRAALDAVDLDVPESLRQMIDRQIGRVGKEEQHMLEAGSVAGMEFSAVSVAAAMEQPVADVEERCDELVRGQLFLRSLGAREWPDRTVATRYAFVHALHRNTLYQRISPGRRRELHQSIGEREETGYAGRAPDIAAELAAHFEPAGDDTRAVRYLAQAAETAMRRHANREAIGYLARARDIATRLPEPARVTAQLALLEQIGLARRTMGDVPAAVEAFTALASYAREHGQAAEEIRALMHLASALSWIDRDRSLAAGEHALELANRLHDDTLQAHVRGYCGVQRVLSRGWRDEDAEACHRAIDVARRAGDLARLSQHVGHYAHLQSHRSEYRAAARTAEDGLRLALDVGDAYHHMTCQFHRAWALLHLGEWGAMRRILSDGLVMAEQNGHHLWARAFRFQTAWLFVHACDFDRARDLCQQEMKPVREGQLGERLGSIVLGCAQLGAKRYGAAQRAFEDVTERTDGRPVLMDWILQMPLRLGLAENWLARRAFGRAREQAAELCRLAGMAGERTYLALGRRVLAEAALAERDGATADRELSHALDAIAEHEAPLAEWKVCATAARSEEAHKRPPRAQAYWARSVAVLDRLAASLADDPELHRTFLAHPSVQAVRRAARRTA